MKDVPAKIRSDKLWKDVYELVVSIYGKISDLIADFPDEEWATASKLRNSANDSLFYTSQAIGNSSAEASLFDWNNARKNLFSLQSMYTFAGKQKFLELEPDVIVRIDDMLEEIDKRITEAKKEVQMRNKEELEPWLEKYRIWQEMQKKGY
jgi:predicted ATP-binding protein involved in virulence